MRQDDVDIDVKAWLKELEDSDSKEKVDLSVNLASQTRAVGSRDPEGAQSVKNSTATIGVGQSVSRVGETPSVPRVSR